MTLHVPRLPAWLHAWQMPVQAVAQQNPWAQKFDWHSPAAPQAVPCGFLPHAMLMQVLGLTQSLFVAHVPRHAEAPHMNGVQDDCVPAWQTPAPLHVGVEVNVEPEQVAEPQVVPAAYWRHAPAPSHMPSSPQLLGLAPRASVHWFKGSVLFAASVHVPIELGSAHERQVPVHELAQHTFCWHWPDWHSAPPPQATPLSFFEQTPLLQT
jgi:hypothetical protein